jgi:hypothetical protein
MIKDLFTTKDFLPHFCIDSFQSQENQDNADGVKNTVNGWVQQRKWPALFRKMQFLLVQLV